jgi:hypothetical protein
MRERNRVQRPEGIWPHNSRERAAQEYMLKRLHWELAKKATNHIQVLLMQKPENIRSNRQDIPS